RVGVAGDAPLLLGPAEHWRGPRGPTLRLRTVRSGIRLVLEVQQAHVPQRLRAEPADLQVVLQDRQRLADLVGGGREELALVLEAGAPGEHAAHVEPFSLHLEEHVFWRDTPGGALIMRATRAVDVVVAAEIPVLPRVDPAPRADLEPGGA